MKPRLLPLLLFLLPVAAVAGPRSSANYAISTDTTDSAGGRVTSASYTNDGNAPKIAGHSTTTSPARIVKHGFIGQLTEVLGLDLTAGTTELGEGTTLQLTARIALDDATFTAVSDAGVSWSALNGPITVGGTGLVTGGSIFQSTTATAQAVHSGFTDTIALTVLDTLTDNFGTYASDGIDDDWQMLHFGPNNPLAAPTANPDGDLHDNKFEFTAGLDPTDPSSTFQIRFEAVPGQPGQRRVIFSPLVGGRTYTVKATSNLAGGAFAPLGSLSISDDGSERTVTDLDASGGAKFYRVQISKP
jgi:hypothetical protein